MLRGVSWVVVWPAGGGEDLGSLCGKSGFGLDVGTRDCLYPEQEGSLWHRGVWRIFYFNFVLPWATMSGGNGSDNSSGSTNTARYQNMGGERERKRKKIYFSVVS